VSSSAELRILLDSTYILPIVGVEVEGVERALVALGRLRRERKARFYYTQFNILEILGKIARLRYDRGVVAAGLSAIEEEFELASPTVEGYIKALDLRGRGHRDLIDLLLYATALTRGLVLLTRDTALIEFLETLGEETSAVMREEEFLERYGTRARSPSR